MDEWRLEFIDEWPPSVETSSLDNQASFNYFLVDRCLSAEKEQLSSFITDLFRCMVYERLSVDQSARLDRLSHFIYSYSHSHIYVGKPKFQLLFNSIANHGGITRHRNERSRPIQWFIEWSKRHHNLQGWEERHRYVDTRRFAWIVLISGRACLLVLNRCERASSDDRESCQCQRTSLHSSCAAWIGIDTEASQRRRHSSSDPLLLRFLIQRTGDSSRIRTIGCSGNWFQQPEISVDLLRFS